MSLSPFLCNIVLDVSHSNQTRRKDKIEKEEVKLSLFVDDMILYIENPKESTKKLLELINEFSKVAGCKVNIQKSVALLYTNNELSERKTKRIIPFPTAGKKQYLGTNLTKDIKDLYSENYWTPKKEIEEDTNKWKHILFSWIERINIIKMSILPKTI